MVREYPDFKPLTPPTIEQRQAFLEKQCEMLRAQGARMTKGQKAHAANSRLMRRMVLRAELERRKENLEPLIQQQDLRGDEWL